MTLQALYSCQSAGLLDRRYLGVSIGKDQSTIGHCTVAEHLFILPKVLRIHPRHLSPLPRKLRHHSLHVTR